MNTLLTLSMKLLHLNPALLNWKDSFSKDKIISTNPLEFKNLNLLGEIMFCFNNAFYYKRPSALIKVCGRLPKWSGDSPHLLYCNFVNFHEKNVIYTRRQARANYKNPFNQKRITTHNPTLFEKSGIDC